jgi:hypothetical protein
MGSSRLQQLLISKIYCVASPCCDGLSWLCEIWHLRHLRGVCSGGLCSQDQSVMPLNIDFSYLIFTISWYIDWHTWKPKLWKDACDWTKFEHMVSNCSSQDGVVQKKLNIIEHNLRSINITTKKCDTKLLTFHHGLKPRSSVAYWQGSSGDPFGSWGAKTGRWRLGSVPAPDWHQISFGSIQLCDELPSFSH